MKWMLKKSADVLDTRAEEMAQLVKSLLHSRRTKVQIPSSCLGKGPLSVAMLRFQASAEGMEAGGSLELADSGIKELQV